MLFIYLYSHAPKILILFHFLSFLNFAVHIILDWASGSLFNLASMFFWCVFIFFQHFLAERWSIFQIICSSLALALGEAISQKSPGNFHWRIMFRRHDLCTNYTRCFQMTLFFVQIAGWKDTFMHTYFKHTFASNL